MAGAIKKSVVDSENVIRELISDKHMSEEEKRQREAMISTEELRREREAREDREARPSSRLVERNPSGSYGICVERAHT